MSAIAIDGMGLGEYDFPERNRRAAHVIQSYAVGHAALDVAIGVGGFLPIPGAGPAAIAASLLAQVPVYRSMVRELAAVYELPLDNVVRRYEVGGIAADSAMTVAADAGALACQEFLLGEFSVGFFTEIAPTLLGESALGAAFSLIPVVGGFATIGLDVAIAATMTWRVGTMVSTYYQNGRRWVDGNRKRTYDASRDMTGGLSPTIEGRVDLDEVRNRVPEVNEAHVAGALRYIERLRRRVPGVSSESVREDLQESNFPDDVIDEAIRRSFG